MSVINKMLRDLDQRHLASTPLAKVGVPPDVLTLRPGKAGAPFGRSNLHLGIGALSVIALLVGGWFWWQSQGADIRAGHVVTPPSLAGLDISETAVLAPAVPLSGTPPRRPGASVSDTSAMTLRMESSLSTRRSLDALLSSPAPGPKPVAAAKATPVRAPTSTPDPAPTPASAITAVAERPKVRTPAASSAAVAAPASESTTPAIQRQQQAGGDAIAQAQNLWNTGSHDAALDLMQQSIAAAERSAKAGTSPGGANALLVQLVREMARMQLAQARFGAVWDMLTRLEPLLGNQADLWAIRANAAQRLGRHQDSVHAYMMALQSRPDEQRWLLGSAVSLAALGQTSSAAEMVEKARAVGPVSKDILAYLRQAGVSFKE